MGDRQQYLTEAKILLKKKAGNIIRSSCIYETAAWGKKDQHAFLNQAVLVETPLDAHHLLDTILYIEQIMGRKRLEIYGPRIIDIDILFFNEDIIDTQQLIIPHPAIAQRRFSLVPMVEIAADFIHPVYIKTMKELLSECIDKLNVDKLDG